MMFYIVNSESREIVGSHSSLPLAELNVKDGHEIVESSVYDKRAARKVLTVEGEFEDNPNRTPDPEIRELTRVELLEQQVGYLTERLIALEQRIPA